VFLLEQAAILLDGASSDEPQERDGEWYAENLGQRLVDLLTADPARELRAILASAIEAMASEHGLVSGESPSSTVTIARWTADDLEVLALGDSPAVVFYTDGTVDVLCDDRQSRIARHRRSAYIERLTSGHGFDQRHAELLQALRATEQEYRNQPQGYWIAEADPKAAFHALSRTWPAGEVTTVLLSSDGVSRGVDKYHRPATWHDARRIVEQDGPDALLALVHGTEECDPNGQQWPRSKCHDDKAVVLVCFAV
jgi:serine/threonine protein phosphatase PrpC